ncbi:hypothetical protein SAMN06295912_12036 [Sphingomonas laterariae]|uniref:Uncharacterized protein n=1 Tax=Edaphosphingomonas laterariae TaxID=861865 RepID=A0A239I046_9SPHN|nr:hypothetical protein SAMN06295912_12036 [Sphingomonas laterariae]
MSRRLIVIFVICVIITATLATVAVRYLRQKEAVAEQTELRARIDKYLEWFGIRLGQPVPQAFKTISSMANSQGVVLPEWDAGAVATDYLGNATDIDIMYGGRTCIQTSPYTDKDTCLSIRPSVAIDKRWLETYKHIVRKVGQPTRVQPFNAEWDFDRYDLAYCKDNAPVYKYQPTDPHKRLSRIWLHTRPGALSFKLTTRNDWSLDRAQHKQANAIARCADPSAAERRPKSEPFAG